MGKLLGLLVAAVGGVIAFHSLSSFGPPAQDPAAVTKAAVAKLAEAVEAVPVPQPATAERRRADQRAQRRNEAKAETPPAPVAMQIVTSAEEPKEAKPTPKTTQIRTADSGVKLDAETRQHAPVQLDLARAIQGHLARVGCYVGPVNGVWSEASQRAMKDFNARVNATLPVDQPDQVLLALVENYKDKACGCLASETSVNGRCVPFRVQQQAQRKAPVEVKEARKTVTSKLVEEGDKKPATTESWKTTAKVAEPRQTKTPDAARTQKPVAVPAPTVVATARQQLEQAKETERREVDANNRMGLGVKPVSPTPATTPQPNMPVATLPQQVPPREPVVEQKQRTAAILPPPPPVEVQSEDESAAPKKVTRTNSEKTAPPSKYVRRISPPPAPVYYRTTSSSYSSYLRSGGIWRRQELNGR